MLRLHRAAVLALTGLAIAAPAGCGSDDDTDTNAGTTKTAPGAEVPPPPLARGDDHAYSELERSSGALRAAAVPVAYGSASRIVVADRLKAAARRLSATRPSSKALARLRRTTLAALRLAYSEGAVDDSKAKGIAKRSIAEADRIDAGLRRYAASHPAANE